MAKKKLEESCVEPVATIEPTKFEVTLNCPTPLAHKKATVVAKTQEEAWEAFLKLNNISGSVHERTIVMVSGE